LKTGSKLPTCRPRLWLPSSGIQIPLERR
jgi:hypothetical protein